MDFKNIPTKKLIGAILGVVLGVIVAILPPPAELTSGSMIVLGLFVWAIVFWIFDVLGFFVTSMILTVAFPLLRVAPFASAFSGYISTTWWFMLGAMGISTALSKSGLMKRFTYSIMKMFAPTYKGQVLGIMASSLVVTPFIPSVTAKTAMVMPIAKGIADSMGYKPMSKEMHGLFLAAFTSITLIGYSFVSSNFFCYFAVGMLPAADQAKFGWIQWLLASLPWLIVVMAGMLFCVLFLYKPKVETSVMTKEHVAKELESMGPIGGKEKFTIAVLLIAVLLWATENIHGISGNLVALSGMLILLVSNIITVPDFKAGIPWDMLLMIGALMGLGSVFDAVGINQFVSTLVTPMVLPEII